MNNKHIPIVLAFTSNYFVPACTCIYSIVSNSKEQFNFICLLQEDLDENLVGKLKMLIGDKHRLTLKNLNGLLQDIYIDERYTIAASYRLLIPEIIEEYDKVIYLDCDIIIKNDLGQIYEIDLQNNYLGAVYEAAIPEQFDCLESIGCKPGQYFNSGVLLMNTDLMRKDDLTKKLLKEANNPNYMFPDQDALNKICSGRTLGLPVWCNSIRTYFLVQYKADFLKRYSLSDWEKVQHIGNIHYTGEKPWNTFTIKFVDWWNVYEKLPLTIREEMTVNHKLYNNYKLLKNKIVYSLFNSALNLYRRLKY
ncbi:glycosyltransferase family 8 protein [Sphingobacterium mizutaii]|uniref:glycosyltransferase family 8 protein n=1 Tax=Sphingobacterium mizutaii TaxID=1010 RepID=UPI003D993CE6